MTNVQGSIKETFYKDLYASKAGEADIEAFHLPPSPEGKTLTAEERTFCEGLINEEECLKALNSMPSSKTPRTDGFPCEFYKAFWSVVGRIFINSLNYSYESGRLSISQRRGIIKLIPKKDSALNLVKNWRPLTLLNCDYKIATKAISNRIKTELPKLISNDQTGFIKDRFIGENIRAIDSIIKYSAAKDIPGLLLFLDFEKAFDTLEWSFLFKTLQHFEFGPSPNELINWIKIFYADIESCFLNNGWTSDFFSFVEV